MKSDLIKEKEMDTSNVETLKDIKNIAATIDLISIRFQYKKRKFIHISDKEFDELIENFKASVIRSHVLLKLMNDEIKLVDLSNNKVQKGKEKSLESKIQEKYEFFREELMNGEDQHHRHDLQPDGTGEQGQDREEEGREEGE